MGMQHGRLRLGFIGLGGWGRRLAEASSSIESVEVSGAFARTLRARDEFAEDFGATPFDSTAALLASDIDAVVIATPIATHCQLAIEAIEAGKHVFVEKPLALDVPTARRAIAAAAEAGAVLQVGHHRRRLAATRRVAQWAHSGELGIVHSMEGTIFNADGLHPRDDWKFDPRQRVLGAMTQQGVHMIDNMQYVAGPAKSVSVMSKQVLPGGRSEDVTGFLIKYESGPVGVILSSAIGASVGTFAVHGTAGSAWSEDDGSALYRQRIGERQRTGIPVAARDAVVDQLVEFAECIRTGTVPEVDGTAALEVVAVLEAGVRSAERGTVVDVEHSWTDRRI
jgi:predicted dehydrogenase